MARPTRLPTTANAATITAAATRMLSYVKSNEDSWRTDMLNRLDQTPRPLHAGTRLHPLDPLEMVSELTLGYAHDLPLMTRADDSSEPYSHQRHSQEQRQAFQEERARHYLDTLAIIRTFEQTVCGDALLALGDSEYPVRSDTGVILDGEPRRAARIAAYNRAWDALFAVDEEGTADTARVRRARASIGTRRALSVNHYTAREQLMERFDRLREARLLYLCDGPVANAHQQTARFDMLRIRQELSREIGKASTIPLMQSAQADAMRRMQDVKVPLSPKWNDGSGEPIRKDTVSRSYTKGTGDNAWRVRFHAYTPVNDAKGGGRAAHGAVEFLFPTSDDFEFETATTSVAADGMFDISRRGAGHPAPGVYDLPVVARNYNGPSRLAIKVLVD